MDLEKSKNTIKDLKHSFLTTKFFPQIEFIFGNILLIAGGSVITKQPKVGALGIVLGFILDYRVFYQTLYDLKVAQDNIEETENRIKDTREDIREAENSIQETKAQIEGAKESIQETQENIEETEDRVEEMKESVFSSISDYESSGFGSIEDGLQRVEENVSELEDDIGDIKSKLKRELNFSFF